MRQLHIGVVDDLLTTELEAGCAALIDPFTPRGFLDLQRFAAASEFVPVAVLATADGELRLLFLDLRPGEAVIVWALKDPCNYIGQTRLPTSALCQLLHASGVRLDCNTVERLLTTDLQREALRKLLAAQLPSGARLTRFDMPLRPRSADFNADIGAKIFFNELRRNWTDEVDILSKAVRAHAGARADIVLSHFEALSSCCLPAGGDGFIERLVASWKCSTLRELYFLHTGEHLAYSPFSARYITASRSILVGNEKAAFRVALYEDERLDFIELSGQGFLSTASAYILPFNAYPFVSCYGIDNQSCWLRAGFHLSAEFITFAIDQLRASTPNAHKEQAAIFNDIGDENLGHTLWNFFPGIVQLLSTSIKCMPPVPLGVGFLDTRLKRPASFSSRSYTTMLRDLCERLPAPPTLHVSKMDGLCLLDTTTRIVMFKSLSITTDVRDAYRGYMSSSYESVVTEEPCIFVNVRIHNKCLLNIEDCIERTLVDLRTTGGRARFVFEGSSAAQGLLDALHRNCHALGLQSSVLVDADAFDLYRALEPATLVIVPVGSGLVIPTWVLNKHCVTFADRDHMLQLNWWNDVTSETSLIDAFSPDEIQVVSLRFNASYRIDPEVFSKRVLSALSASELASTVT